jgi:hypothetical protein
VSSETSLHLRGDAVAHLNLIRDHIGERMGTPVTKQFAVKAALSWMAKCIQDQPPKGDNA